MEHETNCHVSKVNIIRKENQQSKGIPPSPTNPKKGRQTDRWRGNEGGVENALGDVYH